jgi:signal transduction histidine kinase
MKRRSTDKAKARRGRGAEGLAGALGRAAAEASAGAMKKANAALETRMARDGHDAARRMTQLRELALELSKVEMSERRQLAADLHDDVGQLVTLARIHVSAMQRSATDDGQKKQLHALAEIIDETNRKIRSLTFQVSPPLLQDLGLRPALEWLGEEMKRLYKLKVSVSAGVAAEPPQEMVRYTLFRAARELLINAAKHAGAKRVTVRMTRRRKHIVLTVRDDGKGFDPEAVDTSKRAGYGLFSIRERMEYLGGSMRLRSSLGKGTMVELIVPAAGKAGRARETGVPDEPDQSGAGGRPSGDATGPQSDAGKGA